MDKLINNDNKAVTSPAEKPKPISKLEFISKVINIVAALVVTIMGFFVFVRLDTLIKNADMTERAVNLIDSVRPKLQIHPFRDLVIRDGKNLTLTISLCNFGKYEIRVKPEYLIISTQPITNEEDYIADNKLNFARDVKMKDIDSVWSVSSTAETNHLVITELADPDKLLINNPDLTLYFSIGYQVYTMPEIVTLIDSLAKKFDVYNIQEISVETYSNTGQIPIQDYEEIGDKCNSR
jgi:hypothetical protein|tara:strand:+ start:31900 stop:32610 length:711 start_codon:yes stop_codon:yes gene_type:complete